MAATASASASGAMAAKKKGNGPLASKATELLSSRENGWVMEGEGHGRGLRLEWERAQGWRYHV